MFLRNTCFENKNAHVNGMKSHTVLCQIICEQPTQQDVILFGGCSTPVYDVEGLTFLRSEAHFKFR